MIRFRKDGESHAFSPATVTVLQKAVASGRAVGMEVTIYNPDRDPTGAAGSTATDATMCY